MRHNKFIAADCVQSADKNYCENEVKPGKQSSQALQNKSVQVLLFSDIDTRKTGKAVYIYILTLFRGITLLP